MIKYALKCAEGHEFDSWFRNAVSFDEQVAQGQVLCPYCGSAEVGKAIMAPALNHGDAIAAPVPRGEQGALERAAQLRALRQHLIGATEDVGPRFPEEARKIAEGTGEGRPIRGQATREEARALVDEGIAIFPLPLLPEDLN